MIPFLSLKSVTDKYSEEIQAAVLRVKLRHLDEDVERRRDVAERYYVGIRNEELGSRNGGVVLPKKLPRGMNAYHLFPILCERRDELQAYLMERGIQTLIHYPIPTHRQTCYQKAIADGSLIRPRSGLPITEQIHAQELSLPIGPTITDAEVDVVVKAVNQFGELK